MKNIVAIGAHFDDVEIGVGGTLFKHVAKGDNVYIVVTEADEHRTGDVTVRASEQLKALKVLGIPKDHLLTFTSSHDESDVIGVLDDLHPDVIHTQYEKDTHQAHRKCSLIGQAVGRKRHITTMFYGGGSSYDFHPQLFSFVDFKKKLDLLNCFKTQVNLGAINLDGIRRKESYWASLVSATPDLFAEGFVVRKMKLEI